MWVSTRTRREPGLKLGAAFVTATAPDAVRHTAVWAVRSTAVEFQPNGPTPGAATTAQTNGKRGFKDCAASLAANCRHLSSFGLIRGVKHSVRARCEPLQNHASAHRCAGKTDNNRSLPLFMAVFLSFAVMGTNHRTLTGSLNWRPRCNVGTPACSRSSSAK